ncbi:hypothetical protein A33Q_0052 [Indibacter alkaliphilus LW1]|uniref:Uncharacterized protein n=1 Tax=Indibacter alkaliphilus (strain CCUG 57479 / KCTC 22604 / LW1) TaxID=1189612 RepID=S2EE12_INDAL|nr:hypothetical protein A33Q_0052 [Indibacter alkaliphilus LW1]
MQAYKPGSVPHFYKWVSCHLSSPGFTTGIHQSTHPAERRAAFSETESGAGPI